MADNIKELGELLTEVIADLRKKVQSGAATAADLNVARQLLKDNNIEALPQHTGQLRAALADAPFTEAEQVFGA